MPVVREQDIQKLLDQIATLLKSLNGKRTPEEEPHPAELFVMPELLRIQKYLELETGYKLKAGVWDKLSQDVAEANYQRVMSVVKRLTKALVPDIDGPTDPSHIMHYKHASSRVIWLVFVVGTALTALDLYQISERWEQATYLPPLNPNTSGPATSSSPPGVLAKPDGVAGGGAPQQPTSPSSPADSSKAGGHRDSATVGGTPAKCVRPDCSPTQYQVFIMVVLMGTLGGLLRLMSSFAKYVGNRQLLRSWIPYYLLMPIEGGALALLIYLLLRVGLLSPTASINDAGSLNVFGVYAIAGLTGLFSSQAMEKLAEVFAVIFNKVQAKDSLDSKGQAKSSTGTGSIKT
ncbi:MAG: hypothetical protein E8D49_07560 [Nitrospira sp.]|nr:MAG: hypothetical protein E8D49_07560 [Nitrospira sp.]